MPTYCLAAALVVCAACIDDDETTTGLDGVSHVDWHELPGRGPQQTDLLFVIDDSIAMAPYQDRLAALPANVAEQLAAHGIGRLDLRIAVTSNDGVLRTNGSIGGSFLTMRAEYDLSHTTNFSGTLEEALRPLLNVGVDATGPSTPLAAVRRVIEENPDGFLRPNAYLAIVVVSAADDASPDSATEYAQLATSTKPDPAAVSVGGIVVQPAPRLDAFFAEFPYRNGVVSIDDADYAPAFAKLIFERETLALPCMRAADVDPDAPGAQYDCTFTLIMGDSERVIGECRLPGEQMCWSLTPEPNCLGDDAVTPRIPPFSLNGFRPGLRTECVVNE